ncbi:MAG: transcription-repair coupling factor [Patescibacteria group bacterium]|nr:transcription-repair coupling factor [Patescibacteria group bacterium]
MSHTEFYQRVAQEFAQSQMAKSLKSKAGKEKTTLTGLNDFGRSLILAYLASAQDKPVIYITKSEHEQLRIQTLLETLWGKPAKIYPALRSSNLNRQEFIQNFSKRIQLTSTLSQPHSLTFFTGSNLIEPLSAPSGSVEVRVAQEYGLSELVSDLSGAGFDRQDKVFQIGEMAVRGGVVDVFPYNEEYPYRIVFNDKKIEEIYTFEPVKGKKQAHVDKLTIGAISSKSFGPNLAEYLEDHKDNFVVILDHTEEITQSLYEMFVASESARLAAINQSLDALPLVKVEAIVPEEVSSIAFDFFEPSLYVSQMERLVSDVKKHLKNNWQVGVATDKDVAIKQIFSEADIAVNGNPQLLPRLAGCSVNSPSLKLLIVSDNEIFSISAKVETKTSAKRQRLFLADIERGDYIVHSDHGIGRLIDIQKIQLNGVEREYLILEYAKGDKLYTPVDQIDKISKYVSVDGRAPQLTRLSSGSWKKAVAKIKKESHKFAKELLDLYAKRQLAQGIAFNSEEFWQKAISDSFRHQETPDQETVINEILKDMQQEKSMDRLLVADVGFGKTEVAVRAAFQAVTSGYQVAYLAPTTILVEQHYKTFIERLTPFKVRIAALSRFKSKAEQDQIVKELKLGEVDVVIGTHRLLSKDIKFKNLGLVIIDEEQRFGVTHKEKLKMLRSEVDVLSLTATPIPRTLNLALSGIRDISVIETPPTNRLPIITTVTPDSTRVIQEAVEKEIKRGGQVYFVHNRVQTIDTVQHKLETLMPEVRFVHAHGQMGERMLAKIMQDFNQNKYDVLIASTIIENGIDNPNVNTLIVDDAGKFGLSQLHQLRGRIGRGQVQAYAYFLYNKGKLSPKALERLKTIQDNTELGSGYNIAMRDLQIRGAGGVLSREQHGHITAIGLSLYTKLLNKAIEEMKSGQKIDVSDVTIDLPVSAFLPVKYVEAESQRLKIYQTLGVLEDKKELEKEFEQIIANYGKLPAEVQNLKKLLELKISALSTQVVTSIVAKNVNPSNLEPDYTISIHLTETPEPHTLKPLLSMVQNLQIGERELKIKAKELGDNWMDKLEEFVLRIKKS